VLCFSVFLSGREGTDTGGRGARCSHDEYLRCAWGSGYRAGGGVLARCGALDAHHLRMRESCTSERVRGRWLGAPIQMRADGDGSRSVSECRRKSIRAFGRTARRGVYDRDSVRVRERYRPIPKRACWDPAVGACSLEGRQGIGPSLFGSLFLLIFTRLVDTTLTCGQSKVGVRGL
jgi:hypothetical protein